MKYIYCKVAVVVAEVLIGAVTQQALHTNFAWFWSAFGTHQSKQAAKCKKAASAFHVY